MRKAVSEGKFREDLYYRLNTIPIQMPPLRERGNDILLLFRLFAMQMAEKYRLPKISLTEDAKALMLKYKWPGNVRQLKNITEQMSVLSREREINLETLSQFIPRDEETTQLATIPQAGNEQHSYESEREMLYKILYELRGNVSDLRREMKSLRDQLDEARGLSGANGFSHHPQNISGMPPATVSGVPSVSGMPSSVSGITSPSVSEISAPSVGMPSAHYPSDFGSLQEGRIYAEPRRDAEDIEAEEIKDTENESENESLNLNELSRQMIERALERNNGNRKKAAEELGISDRTLYRRIKKYDL